MQSESFRVVIHDEASSKVRCVSQPLSFVDGQLFTNLCRRRGLEAMVHVSTRALRSLYQQAGIGMYLVFPSCPMAALFVAPPAEVSPETPSKGPGPVAKAYPFWQAQQSFLQLIAKSLTLPFAALKQNIDLPDPADKGEGHDA